MLIGGIVGMTAFFIMAFANQLWLFIVAITLTSMSRSFWDPASKALVGDLLPIKAERELALQLSYFMTNTGAGFMRCLY